MCRGATRAARRNRAGSCATKMGQQPARIHSQKPTEVGGRLQRMNSAQALEALRLALRRQQCSLATERTYCGGSRATFAISAPRPRPQPRARKRSRPSSPNLAVLRRSAASQNQALNAHRLLSYACARTAARGRGCLACAPSPAHARRAAPAHHACVYRGDRGHARTADPPRRAPALRCGLRLNEALSLRMKDVDPHGRRNWIRDAKHRKDRVVPLPRILIGALADQMARAEAQWREDFRERVPMPLPGLLRQKTPHAEYSRGWFWLFPGRARVRRSASGPHVRWRWPSSGRAAGVRASLGEIAAFSGAHAASSAPRLRDALPRGWSERPRASGSDGPQIPGNNDDLPARGSALGGKSARPWDGLPTHRAPFCGRNPIDNVQTRPVPRITRWQGMRQAIGFAPTAPPTAREAVGAPMARARSRYVTSSPACTAQQSLPDLDLKIRATRMEAQLRARRTKDFRREVRDSSASSTNRARGQSARNSASAASRGRASPVNTSAQTPFSVEASRHSPKGVTEKPCRISTPSPARLNSPGVTASQVTSRSCSRPGPERPASRAASSTRSPPRRSRSFASSFVRNLRKRMGSRPPSA